MSTFDANLKYKQIRYFFTVNTDKPSLTFWMQEFHYYSRLHGYFYSVATAK